MAALWLHTAPLLVLLVMACPSSPAITPVRLCGSHLVDALYLICGDRGFFYNPKQNYVPPQAGTEGSVGGEGGVPDLTSQDTMKVKRSIITDCCRMRCNIFDLESYCN